MSHNTWIHHGVRVLVKPLARTAVTPNHLTAVRLAFGVAAAAAFAVGAPPWADVGGAVFVLSVILDRADGELARMTGRASAHGHTFDLVADATSITLVLIGVGVGLRDGSFGAWAVPMGFVAGVAVAMILWLVVRIENVDGARAAELPPFCGFDVDDSQLLLPVAIWLGYEELLLVAAVMATPAVLAFIWWRLRRRERLALALDRASDPA